MVVVLLRLVRRLVRWGRLQRGLQRGLERGLRLRLRLRLVWRGQRGVQRPLQTGLRVGGQEGLSRAWQEGLARRDEGPRSCRPRLAEVQEPHRPWRLEGWPHGPLSGEHRLLPLLTERWAGLGERQRAGRGHRVTTAEERGRRWRWRGTSLLQEEMAWEPRLT